MDLGELDPGGLYQWRRRGEHHAFSPDVVTKLQHAVSSGKYETYKAFSELVNDQAEQLCTLRGLFKLKFAETPLALEEVEPASEIVKRFCTGAMSFGSISKEAHETLAIAMNQLGGRSNTGEGGEDPSRFQRSKDGHLRRSAIKQVASEGLVSRVGTWSTPTRSRSRSRRAKPGEGGQLPGHKVNDEIAKIRHSTGVTLISPPRTRHLLHRRSCPADLRSQVLEQQGEHQRQAGPETGWDSRGGCLKGKPMGLSSAMTGTGATQTSLKYAGVPWQIESQDREPWCLTTSVGSRFRWMD